MTTPLSSRKAKLAASFMIAAVLLLAELSPGLLGDSVASPGPGLAGASDTVEYRQGLLTLDVRDTPLKVVLRAIAEKAKLTIEITGDTEARVTQSFWNIPLDDAIHRLLSGHSFALSYRPDKKTLARIWIIGSAAVGREASSSNLPTTSTPAPTLSENPPVTPEGNQREIAEVSDVLLHDNNPLLREAAAGVLKRAERGEAAEVLRRSLKDSSPQVRIQALRSLRAQLGADVLGDLKNVLLTDTDPGVRREAIVILSSLPGEEARQTLESEAAISDDAARRQIAMALERWKRLYGGTEERNSR